MYAPAQVGSVEMQLSGQTSVATVTDIMTVVTLI